jgi:hypothetical protein
MLHDAFVYTDFLKNTWTVAPIASGGVRIWMNGKCYRGEPYGVPVNVLEAYNTTVRTIQGAR